MQYKNQAILILDILIKFKVDHKFKLKWLFLWKVSMVVVFGQFNTFFIIL